MELGKLKRALCLYVLFFLASQAKAQIDTLLFESLKNSFPLSASALAEHPSGYSDWTFENCVTESDGDVWVGVGDGSAPGSVTTPALTGLTGNVRVTVQVRMTEASSRLYVYPVGSETAKTQTISSTSWYRIPCILITNANPEAGLKFYAKTSGGEALNSFKIANILLCDIGDNVYYESFDRINGSGGNDGTFSVTRDENSSTVATDYDYRTTDPNQVRKGYKCVAFDATEEKPATLQTAIIPATISSTTKAYLTFRVAGTSGTMNFGLNVLADKKTLGTADIEGGTWKEQTIEVTKLSGENKLTFSGYNCFLDDVRVWEAGFLSESASNSAALAQYRGTKANIELERTLGTGYWNTLCLPFDFSTDEASLPAKMRGIDVQLRRLTAVADGVFTFTPAASVPAGEPFLIKVGATVSNPVFRNVTITATEPGQKAFGDYRMVGTFGPVSLSTGGTQLFLDTEGYLNQPEEGYAEMQGLRAYFEVPDVVGVSRVQIEQEPAGIGGRTVARSSSAAYRLDGRPAHTLAPTRGLLVVDGKKVIR